MAYLNDKEKRLLFSALSREKDVCKKMDEEGPGKTLLEPIVEELERKFYYDKFEKEIRNKAIEEFSNLLNAKLSELGDEPAYQHTGEDYYVGICSAESAVWDIAEKMKKG